MYKYIYNNKSINLRGRHNSLNSPKIYEATSDKPKIESKIMDGNF